MEGMGLDDVGFHPGRGAAVLPDETSTEGALIG